MTYEEWVEAMATLFEFTDELNDAASATPFNNSEINIAFQNAIIYAENRMYRELDLLETVESQTANCTANTRTITKPTSIIVLQSMNIITPVTFTPDQSGATRNPLQRVSIEFLNLVCPAGSVPDASDIPTYYADKDNATILLGPAPGAAYTAEFVGTFRPDPLAFDNTTTILTTYLPDMWSAATSVYLAGWERDFGVQGVSTDPQTAMSWERVYRDLGQSATIEIARKKGQAPAWQPYQPAPLAKDARTS